MKESHQSRSIARDRNITIIISALRMPPIKAPKPAESIKGTSDKSTKTNFSSASPLVLHEIEQHKHQVHR